MSNEGENIYEIIEANVESYVTYLKEPYRPPSRGGNTKALHAHCLTVNGETFSFLALGAKKFVYKGELISFKYQIVNNYKNIIKETISSKDKKGVKHFSGNRDYKLTLRTSHKR